MCLDKYLSECPSELVPSGIGTLSCPHCQGFGSPTRKGTAGWDIVWQPQPEVEERSWEKLQVTQLKLYLRPLWPSPIQEQSLVLSSLTLSPNPDF